MAVDITLYTDTDKVRARMGVDTADVSDEVLESLQLDLQLELTLSGYGIGAAAIKTAYDADNSDPVAKKSWYLLQLFSASFCAAKAVRGRDFLFPFLFKDGKAETRRFSGLSVDAIADKLDAEAKNWLDQLLEDQSITVPATPIHSPVLVVTPTVDPVTSTG